MTERAAGGRLVRSAQVVEAAFGADERALLHLRTGRYHVLNAVGARIWELLAVPADIDALCAALADEYAVASDTCRHDVRTYLDRLVAEDLIEAVP